MSEHDQDDSLRDSDTAVAFLESDALQFYKSQRIENEVGDILKSADRGIDKLKDPDCAVRVLNSIRDTINT